MTPQAQALQEKRPALALIPKELITQPSMPMDTFLSEAQYLFKWCQPDREPLRNAGLDWALVEDLPVRILACSEAQANWHDVRFGKEEAQRRWVAESPAGYALRDETLHYMRYAYRNLPDLHARIDSVAEGTSDADMIQDLNDLAVIGRENLAPLLAVGFDPALLDQAASLSESLGKLRADASVDKSADREQKKIRDRAYTHLKEAVDAIRECGKFVFWKDEERARGYASDYRRKQSLPRPPAEEVEPTDDSTPAAE